MFTPVFITETVAFFGCLFAASVILSRFYTALERREPGLIPDDSQWGTSVKGPPTRFPPIAAAATRARLRALVRTWPYREVERLRWWSLTFLALALIDFAWIAFTPP